MKNSDETLYKYFLISLLYHIQTQYEEHKSWDMLSCLLKATPGGLKCETNYVIVDWQSYSSYKGDNDLDIDYVTIVDWINSFKLLYGNELEVESRWNSD